MLRVSQNPHAIFFTILPLHVLGVEHLCLGSPYTRHSHV